MDEVEEPPGLLRLVDLPRLVVQPYRSRNDETTAAGARAAARRGTGGVRARGRLRLRLPALRMDAPLGRGAAPPACDEIGGGFKQTAQPSENPADLAFAVVAAAVCVLKG